MPIGMHTLIDWWFNQWKKKEGRRSGRILSLRRSAGTIFRLHACRTDADCACIRVNYGQLALPRCCVQWPQYHRLATIY